jgi:hypothetical protein
MKWSSIFIIGLCTCIPGLAQNGRKRNLNQAVKNQVDTQLQLIFNRADSDHDGFLDEMELAKSFRGAKAKPAPPLYDDKGNLTSAYARGQTKYPDRLFLYALDKDGDGRVSWDEFRTQGEAYAAALQKQQAQLMNMQRAYMQAARNRARQMARNVNYYRRRQRYYYRHPYYHRRYGGQNPVQLAMRYQQNLLRMQRAMYSRYRSAMAHRMAQMHFHYRRR